jgi:phosphoribosylanthranilate isomerase
MGETKIKICGITTPEDALLCHRLGADYLGVIFAESPRRVDPARAAQIRRAVPQATLVGVFADQDPAMVLRVARSCALDVVQLHGAESPSYCADLCARAPVSIIKTLTVEGNAGSGDISTYSVVSFFLFDRPKRGAARAVSVRSLWALAARTGRNGARVFLAGGLTPANVREAVDSVVPFAVDVCSGVERAPGIKDASAVGRFIAEVRR